MTTTTCQGPRITQDSSFTTTLRSSLQAWRLRRQQRRAMHELGRLSNHALKDIGIHRSEITSIIHVQDNHRRRRYAGN
jgi:uncharacterized protein YjiS (DUF1127 family)